MPVLLEQRPRVPGLNSTEILYALENILASIQPGNSPAIRTNGSVINYSTAVRAVRRERASGATVPEHLLPWIGVRRMSEDFENAPSRKLMAKMQVELTLRVRGQSEVEADNNLMALEDDVLAAVYSGYAMNPNSVGGQAAGYAHNVRLVSLRDLAVVDDPNRAEASMTWEITYLRGTGKEATHTGYNP